METETERQRKMLEGFSFIPFVCAGDQTQDLMHAREVFYCSAISPAFPSLSFHLSLQPTGWCCLKFGLMIPPWLIVFRNVLITTAVP